MQYEQLVKDGSLILQWYDFAVEHHHGPIGNRADRPNGNGVLLWFEVAGRQDHDGRYHSGRLRFSVLYVGPRGSASAKSDSESKH
jgi:hypothetical protein